MKLYSIKFNPLISLMFFSQIITTLQSKKFLSFREESFSKEYMNLVEFIKTNGGYINPKLTINEISPKNRFVLTKENIKKNETILFIP